MALSPVFLYETVTGSRRARHFLLRLGYVGVLLVVLWMNYSTWFRFSASAGFQQQAQFASYFFSTFAVAQLIAVVLLTPAFMAGAISSERERRTIDYLLTSQLSSTEIILGKFASRLLQVALQLLAGAGLLSVLLMMGGIEPLTLLLTFMVAGAALLSIASGSLLVSVWARRPRDAVIRAYLLMLLMLLAPPMLLGVCLANGWRRMEIEAIVSVNPFVMLVAAQQDWDDLIAAGWLANLGPTLFHLLFTATCLCAAVLSLRPACSREVVRAETASGATKSRRHRRRIAWGLHSFASLDSRPMLWKELASSRKLLAAGKWSKILTQLIVAALAIGAVVVFFYIGLTDQDAYFGYTITMTTLLGTVSLLVVVARGASSVTGEREQDTWTTLLTTDLTPAEIIYAKVIGAMYSLRGVVLGISGLWLLALISAPQRFLAATTNVVMMLTLMFFSAALGVYLSLHSRTTMRAISGGACLLLFIGGGYEFCCFPCIMFGNPGSDELAYFLQSACIPFLLAAPSIVSVEDVGNEASWMLIVAFVGWVGYGVTGMAISGNARGAFATVCQRAENAHRERSPGAVKSDSGTDQLPGP